MMLCSYALALFGPAAIPVRQEEEAPFVMELVEEFRAVGAEPTFWATRVRCDFARRERPTGIVDFVFDLDQLEAMMGNEEPLRFIPLDGVAPLVVGQNPVSQKIDLASGAAVVAFLNGLVDRLGERPRTGSWNEPVQLFDGRSVPGLERTSVNVSFQVESLPVGREVFTLIQFQSESVGVRVEGSRVELAYSGLALLDIDKRMVYNTIFEQAGTVDTGGRSSEVKHLALLTLLDQGDQPVVPLEGRLLELVDAFVMQPRPDGNLNPEIRAPKPRPAWANSVWIAGRLASAAIGLIGEQATNPLPVSSVGGLMLTDQAIGYAGNLYLDYQDLEAGLKDETAINPNDGEFLSPMQRAYLGRPEEDRDLPPILILSGATGAVSIGKKVFGLGISTAAAQAALDSGGASALGFATAATASTAGKLLAAGWGGSEGGAIAATTGGGLSLTTIGIGAVAVGGVAAAAGGGGGGGGGGGPGAGACPSCVIRVTFFETTDQGGCCFGNVDLEATGVPAGATIALQGIGNAIPDPTGGCPATGAWNETAMTTSTGGMIFLTIPVPLHDCLDGTISVRVNGVLADFEATNIGMTVPGQVSSPCF